MSIEFKSYANVMDNKKVNVNDKCGPGGAISASAVPMPVGFCIIFFNFLSPFTVFYESISLSYFFIRQ